MSNVIDINATYATKETLREMASAMAAANAAVKGLAEHMADDNLDGTFSIVALQLLLDSTVATAREKNPSGEQWGEDRMADLRKLFLTHPDYELNDAIFE